MKHLLTLSFALLCSFITAQITVPVEKFKSKNVETSSKPKPKIASSQDRVLKVEKHVPQEATRSIKGEKKIIESDCKAESGVLKMECLKSAIGSGELSNEEETLFRKDLSKLESIFVKKMSSGFVSASKQQQSYFLEYLKANQRDAEYQEYLSKLK